MNHTPTPWNTFWWTVATSAEGGMDFASVVDGKIVESIQFRTNEDDENVVRHIDWVVGKKTRPKVVSDQEAGLRLLRVLGSIQRPVVVAASEDIRDCALLLDRLLASQGAEHTPPMLSALALRSAAHAGTAEYDADLRHLKEENIDPIEASEIDAESLELKGDASALALDVSRSLRAMRINATTAKGRPVPHPPPRQKTEKAIRSCSACRLGQHSDERPAITGASVARVLVVVTHQSGKERALLGRLRKSAKRVGLTPEHDLAVTYAVRCFPYLVMDPPSGKRAPMDAEVQACEKYVLDEIRLLRPASIVIVGKLAVLEQSSIVDESPDGLVCSPGEALTVPAFYVSRKGTKDDDTLDVAMRRAAVRSVA